MSYDIYLNDPVTKTVIVFDQVHDLKGGTYQVGGSKEAWLNITYNYSPHFKILGPRGIQTIYGLTGAESIPILEEAIAKLADDIDSDYWKPTEGNAKQALKNLLSLAEMRPDGIWSGD